MKIERVGVGWLPDTKQSPSMTASLTFTRSLWGLSATVTREETWLREVNIKPTFAQLVWLESSRAFWPLLRACCSPLFRHICCGNNPGSGLLFPRSLCLACQLGYSWKPPVGCFEDILASGVRPRICGGNDWGRAGSFGDVSIHTLQGSTRVSVACRNPGWPLWWCFLSRIQMGLCCCVLAS